MNIIKELLEKSGPELCIKYIVYIEYIDKNGNYHEFIDVYQAVSEKGAYKQARRDLIQLYNCDEIVRSYITKTA